MQTPQTPNSPMQMSGSAKALAGIVGAVLIVGGTIIGWQVAPRTIYAAQPQQIAYAAATPQANALLEQVTEIMRLQSEDFRKNLAQYADANQKMLAQHAQNITQVLSTNAQSAVELMAQTGTQVDQLARMEQVRLQETNHQVAYLIEKVEDQANRRVLEVASAQELRTQNARELQEKVAYEEQQRQYQQEYRQPVRQPPFYSTATHMYYPQPPVERSNVMR